ncbi:type I restriction endonuclease subunit R [Catenulispora pinisilvae]|uniref:type I restriction endonuclease subunit R n=1 Tax=Catenulispora pinisilvae TaxID=2705253 RepID=UPI00189115BD|nr:type I restriction endonuclease [Catenulispora pinisilvae]
MRVERDEVEVPFIEQLKAMGWQHIPGPELDRDSLADVLLKRRVDAALRRINTHNGVAWLDDERIEMAIRDLGEIQAGALLEANQTATARLLGGITVPGDATIHGGVRATVSFIDFNADRLALNEFIVSDQVRIRRSTGEFAVLDLVLFVNGIPLVVVECKSPDTFDAVNTAIRDLRAYAGVPLPPPEGFDPDTKDRLVGVGQLFHTVQLLVATCGEQAKLGTITSDEGHFAPWRSILPESEETLRSELRAAGLQDGDRALDELTEQEKLVGVVLRPARLLDIVRHFVLFMPVNTAVDGGKIIKIVCRHQQYRAVVSTVERLRTGSPPATKDDADGRGGVVFHTQGSGKSLTMTFLVRVMRSDSDLQRFTVLVVTDRKDLQRQLSRTLRFSGDDVVTADTGAQVQALVAQQQSRVVFAMIQKYGKKGSGFRFSGDAAPANEDEDLLSEDPEPDPLEEETPALQATDNGLVHSDSADILVIVDEAHRSHTAALHAFLTAAVPNAARIGFTGTPIVRSRTKTTVDIFGPYLDRYRIEESERDGATVRILYEGRTGPANIVDRAELDAKHVAMVHEQPTDSDRGSRMSMWPTTTDVTESSPLIRAKARDMLRHYVATALQGAFKAQVAVASRAAAVSYRRALNEARDQLIAELSDFDPATVDGVPDADLDPEDRFHRTAHRFLPILQTMDFVPVISGDSRKETSWRDWIDPKRQQEHVDRFLEPLPQYPVGTPWSGSSRTTSTSDSVPASGTGPWSQTARPTQPTQQPPIAFLIVKSMLLTGFDAPIEQVLYIDRTMREAELLQAIARVNRPAAGKTAGYVVDYVGLFDELRSAMESYEDEDAQDLRENLIHDFISEADELAAWHRALQLFLETRGITSLDSPGGLLVAVLRLSQPRDRLDFDDLVHEFATRLENLLPRPEALAYVDDAKQFALLQKRLRRRYRDGLRGDFDLRRYGRRVRALIADHLELPEINQVIPPVSISTLGFSERAAAAGDPQSVASEMASALRFHLEDRVRSADEFRFQRISDRLEAILRELDGRWDEQIAAIKPLIEEAMQGQDPDLPGMTALEQAAYRIMEQNLSKDAMPAAAHPDGEWFEALREMAILACDVLATEIGSVAYRGSHADIDDSAHELYSGLLMPWRQLHGPGFKLADYKQAIERLSKFGRENADQFRARSARMGGQSAT